MKNLSPSQIILGIDFGNTVERKIDGVMTEWPRALDVISQAVAVCKDVYIISKVNERQMFEVVQWMYKNQFFTRTKLPMEHLWFTASRAGKAPIVKKLGINVMIDDRPEVMFHLPNDVRKLLFNPNFTDIEVWKQGKTPIVTSWNQVERVLFDD